MSSWSENESLDEDPLDPTRGTGGEQPEQSPRRAWQEAEPQGSSERAGADGGQPVDAPDQPDEAGVGDPSGAVRVLLDGEAFRVVSVSISARWRERLRRAGGSDLGHAVQTACRRAQLSPPQHGLTRRSLDDLPTGPRRSRGRAIDWAGFNAALETTLALSEEGSRLAARPPEEVRRTRVTSPLAEGVAAQGKVRVQLGLGGAVRRCEIDQDWAEDSRVSELVPALDAAFAAAYDAWRPPEHEPGEHEELVERRAEHRRHLLRLISGRDG